MPTIARLAYAAKMSDLEPGRRRVRAVITTDSVDRYSEVIVPKGISTKGYMKNPVLLWCHDAYSRPIGRSVSVEATKDGRGLSSLFEFADTDDGNEVFSLYEGGFLKAFSVGVKPDMETYSAPKPAEIKARPDLANCQRMIRNCELVEVSACAIPANPDALATAVNRGLLKSLSLRREIEDAAPHGPPLPRLGDCRTFAQAHAELMLAISAQGRKAAGDARARMELARGVV